MITKPVPVSLSVRLHPQILFLAREESVVGRNVLLVEHSQGRLTDISGTLTLLMVLGFSSQSSRPAGRAWSAGDQPLYHASQDEPKVKLHEMEFPVRPLRVSGI